MVNSNKCFHIKLDVYHYAILTSSSMPSSLYICPLLFQLAYPHAVGKDNNFGSLVITISHQLNHIISQLEDSIVLLLVYYCTCHTLSWNFKTF